MALMKCPECGKEISDKAEKCPNCGYTIQKARIKKSKMAFIVIIIVALLIVCIVLAMTKANPMSNYFQFGSSEAKK